VIQKVVPACDAGEHRAHTTRMFFSRNVYRLGTLGQGYMSVWLGWLQLTCDLFAS
jgi:hypothetical protein